EYLFPQQGTQSLPRTATPILPPANVTPKKSPRPVESNNDSLNTQEIVLNGQSISEEEFRAFCEHPQNDPEDMFITHSARSLPSLDHGVPFRSVVFNDQLIRDPDLAALDFQNRSPIPNGQYWYDHLCGAWGFLGGPCEGFIAAGMSLGGKLRSDASNGDTGVF